MHTEKTKIRVSIFTGTYRIEGDLHVLPGSRLTDLVNVKARNDFMPVTRAVVYGQTKSELLYEVDFISINRDSIIMMFPIDSEDKPDINLL